jgi:hypothetical protein
MIGPGYWSTGITISRTSRGQWRVTLDFFDDGFAEDGSTEGILRVRYDMTDLGTAVDLLKDDAERLGITWRDPAVYAKDDAEQLKPFATRQSTRLGWEPCYRLSDTWGVTP